MGEPAKGADTANRTDLPSGFLENLTVKRLYRPLAWIDSTPWKL
jgi:hypothetical protein